MCPHNPSSQCNQRYPIMAHEIVRILFSILCFFNIHPSRSAVTRNIYTPTGRIEETTVICDCCSKKLEEFKEYK